MNALTVRFACAKRLSNIQSGHPVPIFVFVVMMFMIEYRRYQLKFTVLIAVWLGFLLMSSAGVPSLMAACDETEGQVIRHEYDADNIQTRMYYSVYLPPCYSAAEATRYPVMYLMHGSNEDDGHWLRLGLAEHLDAAITEGTIPPVIAVLPFGNWIANENRFGGASWDDIFINQLMPLVESQYRIDGTRSRRAIGGVSRGGFWAFHIAFRYPVMFGVVGGHSAFFDRYHAPPEYNPLDLALNAAGVESLRIMLDRGRDDFAYPGLDIMDERLRERGVDYTYVVHPEGQHHNGYWRSHLADYVAFYTATWPLPERAEAPQTPVPSPTPEPENAGMDSGVALFLPVIAFPAIKTTLPDDTLQALRRGEAVPRLILGEGVADRLAEYGVVPNPEIRVVPDDALFNLLSRDRQFFTLLPFDAITPRYRVLNIDESHPLDDIESYPLAFASDAPNFYPERLTRLLMSGVTALARQVIPSLDANGVEWAAEGILPYVSRADFFHTSNEVSIVPDCPRPNLVGLGGNSSFCSKAEHFELFNLLGLDIVELSGNHNNDYGYQAYLDTLAWYAEHGIMTVGGGADLADAREPLIVSHNDNSIAMLSCNWVGPYYALVNEDPSMLGGVRPGAAFCDRDWLAEVVPALQSAHDVVVVTVQHFELDQYTPGAQQRADFYYLADLGADVILGTSSHFPQTFEFYRTDDGRDAFIHHGMGNLFFDQQFFAGRRFFMDQLFVYDGRLLFVDLFTGIIDYQARPRPMTDDERENFMFIIMVQHGGF